MDKQNILYVINPAAHNWQAQKEIPEIEKTLQEYKDSAKEEGMDFNFKIIRTQIEGTEQLLLEEMILDYQRYDKVVTAGGDGTTHEVVNILTDLQNAQKEGSKTGDYQAALRGLVTDEKLDECSFELASNGPLLKPTIGILPYGTACDGAKAVQQRRALPGSLKKNLGNILYGNIQSLDVFQVEAELKDGTTLMKYGFDSCGIGFDAAVLYKRNKFKKVRGYAGYIVSIFDKMFSHKKKRSLIRMMNVGDDEPETIQSKVLSLVMTNLPVYASLEMDANKSMGDGCLDAYIFKNRGKIMKQMAEVSTTKMARWVADVAGLIYDEAGEAVIKTRNEAHAGLKEAGQTIFGKGIKRQITEIDAVLLGYEHLQIDGEYVGLTDNIKVRVVPGALNVVVGNRYKDLANN